MVWLLRTEPRWLVDALVSRKIVLPDRYIEMLPTETWPVGEENRYREIRADLVMRLWDSPPPENPSLALIHQCGVVGVIGDFQNQRDVEKGLRLIEYDSAYLPVLGPKMCLVVMTFDEKVAQWARDLLSRRRPTMRCFVLTPRRIPRSGLPDPIASPRRALLEAMVHVRGRGSIELLANALRALRGFSGNELLIYREMLMSQMQATSIMEAQQRLEAEDSEAQDERWKDYVPSRRERQSYLYVQGREEGREEGRARSVLELLHARGLDPDPAAETRILECRDPDQLSKWLVRILTITRLDELFE